MPRSLRDCIICLLVFTSLVAIGPVRVSAAPGSAGRLILSISPSCFTVGKPARLSVRLSGLRSHELVAFQGRPANAGFGGGDMGLHVANASGVIRFTYPHPARYSSEVGRWTVFAYRHKGHHVWVAASKSYVVKPRGHRCR